jgi:hypothetical protein
MKVLKLTIFLFLFSFLAKAQVDNSLLENNSSISDSKWQLNVYNHNFMRNYEYFNKFADGLTYFGTILQPTVTFNPQKNLSLEGGVFLRKDYGAKALNDNQSTFRINYHPGKWQIIAGQLKGNVSHHLPEAIYNYDRIITNHLEFGNQFIYEDSTLHFDAWINWENMIYKISPVQEVISGGFHGDWKYLNTKTWEVNIPFSFLVYHKGGQIDTPDRPLQTLLNTAIGAEIKYHYNNKPHHYIFADAQWMTFNDFSFTKVFPANNGHGIMANLGWKFGHTSLSTTYWNANNFYAVHGAPLYSSSSEQMNNPGYYQSNRNLLFVRLISDYNISKNFSISARLEPYWDLDNPSFEFSNSLFLTYRDAFDLKRRN